MPGPIKIEKLSKIEIPLLVKFSLYTFCFSNTHISTVAWFNHYSYNQQKIIRSPAQYEDEDESRERFESIVGLTWRNFEAH